MIFHPPPLEAQEVDVIGQIHELRAQLRWAVAERRRWTGVLRRMSLARAIQGSNSIEGYNASLEDAMAIAEGENPLEADTETTAALNGYRQAMTYVLQLSDDPHFGYSEDLLRSLHFMMMQYDLSKGPGRYRPGFIYIRNDATGDVVYEGPGAERLPHLMSELVANLESLNDSAELIRAAMAHLNLALIHPFRDGNGRMARCLQTLVLSREGILGPEFCSIEEYLGRNTKDYCDVLAQVGGGHWQPGNDSRPWVRFCLTAHYRQAWTLLRRVRESERLWELLATEVGRRGMPERMIVALFDAASGFRVRNATYRVGAEVSDQTASRDLKELSDAGLLVPHGQRRGRHYMANDSIKKLRAKSLDVKLPIEDPFSASARSRSES
ncbi:MAG: Fic family protein [Actinobacteria bacterium]|nr:Fic family protein [Actinomycetota bacterium]